MRDNINTGQSVESSYIPEVGDISIRSGKVLAESRDRYDIESFFGKSIQAEKVRDTLRMLVAVPFRSLIIHGETGTGKSHVARILHRNGSRAASPMIEINCAAIPKEMMEAQLFGHEDGAFPGAKGRHMGFLEQANGGILFMDEVTELDLGLQAKLLKALEEQRFNRIGDDEEVGIDVQVVVASNKDLEQAVKEGSFLSDLYRHLNNFNVYLPTLRSRMEDMIEMVFNFVAEFNQKTGRKVEIVPGDAWKMLFSHRWPGNVRELRNVIERCVLFSESHVFPSKWLMLNDDKKSESSTENSSSTATGMEKKMNTFSENEIVMNLDGSMSLDEMDKKIIAAALEKHRYNVTAAARLLRTTRETLRYRIRKYGLQRKAPRNLNAPLANTAGSSHISQ